MKQQYLIAGIGTITGALMFTLIVVALHLLQPNYDPVYQHMSELALGPYGSMMLIAFVGFATAIISLQAGLHRLGAPSGFCMLLISAAVCLLGAGIFRLDAAPVLHVSLIATAFIILVVAMYLLPRTVAAFKTSISRLVSWGLGAGTALSVSLGGTIPAGIAQRMAASSILIWLLWAGWQIIAANDMDGAKSGS